MRKPLDDDPLVDRLAHALSEFLVPLRMGEGLLTHAFDDVLRAVRECGDAWASATVIPKRAAMLLSDAYPMMDGCTGLYDPETQNAIVDATTRLGEAAHECIYDR